MSGWYLLAAIPVFGILVIVHEFGHFITAKWSDIRVEEFAIGFPPRLFGFRRGETLYSVNLLPIGGFVRMPGENGEKTDEAGNFDPRSFAAKPAGKRAIVLCAGVTMNLLLALVLFTTAEALGQPQFRPVIGTVVAGSPAQQAGLMAGDRIITIDGNPIKTWADVLDQTSQADATVPASAQTFDVIVVVQRPGNAGTMSLIVHARAHPAANQGFMGIAVDQTNPYVIRPPIWQAPALGMRDIGTVTAATATDIAQIIRGQAPFLGRNGQGVTGPVGIVTLTGQAASVVPQFGPYELIFLTAFLSLNLAFVNILPIPALDGGRLLFIGIEVLRRGKPVSPEREALANLIGMGALLLLMLVVTINDIGNIVH